MKFLKKDKLPDKFKLLDKRGFKFKMRKEQVIKNGYLPPSQTPLNQT